MRENCFKRVRQDRSRLLWKCRLSSSDELDIVLRDIVSDELNKINNNNNNNNNNDDNDLLWNDDDDGPIKAQEGDCEDILLEMQNLFYQDLNSHPPPPHIDIDIDIDTWEDDYLARAVYDHMHLNNPDNNKVSIYLSI